MEITVKGNLGADPELKFVTDKHLPLITFPLAHTPRTRKGNEWVEGETVWLRVAMFGEKAESYMDFLAKGDNVVVIGTLKPTTYQGKDGKEKTGLEVNASSISKTPRATPKKKAEEPFPWNG
jgi:single-strand DNA-binding protein